MSDDTGLGDLTVSHDRNLWVARVLVERFGVGHWFIHSILEEASKVTDRDIERYKARIAADIPNSFSVLEGDR